jgi:hypothetical protein
MHVYVDQELDDLSLKSYLHTHLAQQVFLKCNATTLCCHLGQIREEKRELIKHIKLSMSGQEKGDLLIQVTA